MNYFKKQTGTEYLIVNDELLTVTYLLKLENSFKVTQNTVSSNNLPIILEEFTNSLITLEDDSEVAPILLQIKESVAAL
jgi:hypothetical protein